MNYKDQCKEKIQFGDVDNGAVHIFKCELPERHTGYHQSGGKTKDHNYLILWKGTKDE